MTESFRIVFFGTPEFAVPALTRLRNGPHRILRVITPPDRPRGRGCRVCAPAVKTAALSMGIDLLQPASIRTDAFIDTMAALEPDLFVVIAFGRILPRRLLEVPRKGTINIHGSLLPKYRGPAPIQWALINGEACTGVTAMLMDEGLDTGDILLKASTRIGPAETSGHLHDRLAAMGADVLDQTLAEFQAGTIRAVPQNADRASYAPLLKKADGRIDWCKTAAELDTFVRGMTPWPGAFTFLKNHRIKIFRVEPIDVDTSAPPGTVIKGFPDELRVAAGKGAVRIMEIQGASGKRLAIADYLCGHPISEGTFFDRC